MRQEHTTIPYDAGYTSRPYPGVVAMDADDADKALASVQLARDHARCGRHGAATAGLMQVGFWVCCLFVIGCAAFFIQTNLNFTAYNSGRAPSLQSSTESSRDFSTGHSQRLHQQQIALVCTVTSNHVDSLQRYRHAYFFSTCCSHHHVHASLPYLGWVPPVSHQVLLTVRTYEYG